MQQVDTVNLITVALAMVVAAAIPALLPRLRLPGVVLEIVLGALIGPQVSGLVHPGPAMNFLADFGLGLLFLMAGFEMDPRVLRGRPIRLALVGWALTLAIAFGASALLMQGGLADAWLFTGLALTTTTLGALLPMLRDADLLSPPYGPLVLAAGAVGEAGPVVVLSLLLARHRAAGEALVMVAFAAGAIAAVALAARASVGYFGTIVSRTMANSGQLPTRLAMCVLILLVVLSESLHIDMVLGAFVAGAVARAALQSHHHEAFSARLDGVGSAFAIPIFFITSGVRLDVASLFSDVTVLAMVPIYALLMLAARGLPAVLLYRRDLPYRPRLALALHSGTQLSLVVAIAGIAVRQGLMPGGQGAALVGGGIVTMILFPALAAGLLGNSVAREARSDAPRVA